MMSIGGCQLKKSNIVWLKLAFEEQTGDINGAYTFLSRTFMDTGLNFAQELP